MTARPITEEDLQAAVDCRLQPTRQAEVAAHLEAHPEIAERVRDYRQQREALRVSFASVAEEPLPAELHLGRMIENRQQPGRRWWRSAAAAAVLLCIGGTGGWLLHDVAPSTSAGIAALSQEAAASYAVYAPDLVHPVEVRADNRAVLLDWAAQRLKRSVTIPDLAASGYRFMGGRVVATAHGPAAMFMYDDDKGTRLVLLTRTMAADQTAPMSKQSHGTAAGVTWASRGIGFSIVAPLPAARLQPIAEEVRRQSGNI
jgi:anti-sigma factor RsiW